MRGRAVANELMRTARSLCSRLPAPVRRGALPFLRSAGVGFLALATAAGLGAWALPEAVLEGMRAGIAWRPSGAGELLLTVTGATVWVLLFVRADFFGRVLLALGAAVLVYKIALTAPDPFVGHADPAGYAEMARSLLRGQGLNVSHVSWHFRSYASLPRPEDHWPPLYSFLTLPFFTTLGIHGLAARLPGVVISCIPLPMAAYGLGTRLTRSRAAGFAAGLHVLLHPAFFPMSFRGYADLVFAWLVVATAGLFLRGFDRPRAFLFMGLAGGMAQYAKGIGVLLLPVTLLFYAGWRLLHRRPPDAQPMRWVGGRTWTAVLIAIQAAAFAYRPAHAGSLFLPATLGLLAAGVLYRWRTRCRGPLPIPDWNLALGACVWVAVLLPGMMRNLSLFGDPFYSTQSHVSGYIGFLPWEQGTYALYWDRELPHMRDRWSDPDRFRERTTAFARTYGWWILAEPGRAYGTWEEQAREDRPERDASFMPVWRAYLARNLRGEGTRRHEQWPLGLAAMAGLSVLAILSIFCPVIRLARGRCRRARLPPPPGACPDPLETGRPPGWAGGWLVLGYGVVLTTFLVLLWEPIHRLEAPATALVVVLGYAALFGAALSLAWLLTRWPGSVRRRSWIAPMLAGAVILSAVPWMGRHLAEPWPDRARREGNAGNGRGWIAAGEWIRENLPGSVTMTRNPWQLHFYSREPAVQIPLGPLEDVARVARHYGVTHIIPDRRRPALTPLTRGRTPRLRRVYQAHGVSIYELDPVVLEGD